MNKKELIDAIAAKTGKSKADTGLFLENFIGAIGTALKKGDKISLIGFGTFSVAKRAGRDARNPQTGKTIKIAPKTVAKFKVGKTLADLVNGGKKK